MFQDKLLASGLAGSIGILTDILIEQGSVWLGLSRSGTGVSLAHIIFGSDLLTPIQITVGMLGHFITGGVLGVGVLMCLYWSGFVFGKLKGAAFGTAFWPVHTVVVPSIAATRYQIQRDAAETLVDLAALIAWGIVTAYVLTRLLPHEKGSPSGLPS